MLVLSVVKRSCQKTADVMPVEGRSVDMSTGKQGVIPLHTLVSLDSADVFPKSDFAASLQKWHEDNKPAGAISVRQVEKAVPKGALPTKTSIKTPRADGKLVLEKRHSTQLARVASCALPSDLYTRGKRTASSLSPGPSTDPPLSSAPLQTKQPPTFTTSTSVQKQPSLATPRTPIHKQPSLSTPRTPIQDRQPPWRQGSGEGKPRPCVTRSMQRKLVSQRSSLPKVLEQAASTAEEKAPEDSACTADVEACTSGSDKQQPLRTPSAMPSKEEAKVSKQGAEKCRTATGHKDSGVAAESSARPEPAENGAAWTSKVAAKVSSIDPLPVETPAQPRVRVTIRPLAQEAAPAKSAAAGASPAHSAPSDTPRSRGLRLPWTPKNGGLLPQLGSVRSPRPGKEGASGLIDPKALVTKRLPRIKVRYRSGEQLGAKPGRNWLFGCFHAPPTQSQ